MYWCLTQIELLMKKALFLLLATCSIGYSQISDFQGLDVQTNQSISLSDFDSKKAVVIIFTSNVCPYSVYYEGRITQLIADYSGQVQFLLINSHSDDKESASEMKNKIGAWGIDVPYIADKDGTIKRLFAARKSPEVFILKPSGNDFSIYYKGAIDNNPQVASDVKEKYLKRNLDTLLQGKSAQDSNTRPVGCIIR